MESILAGVSFVFMGVVILGLLFGASRFFRAKQRAACIVHSTNQNLEHRAHIAVTESSDPGLSILSHRGTTGYLFLTDKELVFSFLNGESYRISKNEIKEITKKNVSWTQNWMIARGPWLVIKYQKNDKAQHLTIATRHPDILLQLSSFTPAPREDVL